MERRGNGLRLLVAHPARRGPGLPDHQARGVRCTRRGRLPVDRAELRGDLGLPRAVRDRDSVHDQGLGHGRADLRERVDYFLDRVKRLELRVRRGLDSVEAASGMKRAKKAR